MNINLFKLPVYLLAGGRSSRFGQDKARAFAGQQSLLEHVAQQTQSFASSVTVIAAQQDQYLDLGFRTLADRRVNLGPLAGLERSLEDCQTDWLLLGSCDTLGIQTSDLNQLFQASRKGKQAVAWRGHYWEPLWALYHQSLLAEVQTCLASQQLSMQALLNQIATQALPNQSLNWLQINHAEDWQKAQVFLKEASLD